VPGDDRVQLGDGVIQLVGILITALATYAVARVTRSGSREANQTTGWTNLVSALQKDVEALRKEEDDTKKYIRDLDQGNRDLARRVNVLEISRRRWKFWGRQVVEVMREGGIVCPQPPESLEDTDPKMDRNRDINNERG
jgi:cell division protein FtsB